MSSSATVLLGMVSSLIATGIFLLAAKVFNTVVIPWIHDHIYRGARVDGTWRFQHSGGSRYEIDIKQVGDQLAGEARFTSAQGTSTPFRISGYIADGSVLGVARPMHRFSIAHATFLFRLRE